MLNQNIKTETESRLERLFEKIGNFGYRGPEVEQFYRELKEILGKKDETELEEWLNNQIVLFLENPHPGKIYALTGVLNIFPLSDRYVDLVAKETLRILQQQLKELSKEPYQSISPRDLDLKLGCFAFLSNFQRRLNQENQKELLEICNEVKKSETEIEFIKQMASEIESKIELK